MELIELKNDFIKLGQALKLANLVESGAEAKESIREGLVKVNDEICIERGRKLYHGDTVQFNGEEIKIC